MASDQLAFLVSAFLVSKSIICSLHLGAERYRQWYYEGYKFVEKYEQLSRFPLAPMGVLAPRSAQPPIDTSEEFLAQVSGVWGNFS